jgi:hypothetical protein
MLSGACASDIDQSPEHLMGARKMVGSWEDWTCYSFVNAVLKNSLPKSSLEELTSLQDKIFETLPLTSQSYPLIPYHFALIAQYLQNDAFCSWQAVSPSNANPGDLLIYIDPTYDPDPLKRPKNAPSGTHIAFVDKVLKPLEFRVIDASRRVLGRRLLPSFEDTSKGIKVGMIAYSHFTLTKMDEGETLYGLKIFGQKVSSPKNFYLLRIIPSDENG